MRRVHVLQFSNLTFTYTVCEKLQWKRLKTFWSPSPEQPILETEERGSVLPIGLSSVWAGLTDEK